MAANSAQEQLMLELVNRARMNPSGEAARFGISLNQGLPPGTITTAPKQVLAMNDFLVLASDRHSNWMLINDQFNHQESPAFPSGRTGLDPDDRMIAAGYSFVGPATAVGENISWIGTTGSVNPTTAIVEQHKSLFLSPGHRTNILGDDFREIGIGQQLGQFLSGGTNWNASMVTQNFALSGTAVFVTGVVYNDTVVNDNFFGVGEQTAGRAVGGSGGVSDVTGAGGGYELGFTTGGAKAISFNLATGVVQVGVTVGATNLKIDVVNGREIWTNTHLSILGGPVTELHALGIQGISLTGGAASEKIFGNAAGNTLTGGGGNDSLDGAGGADTMRGQSGNDSYSVNHAGDVVDETGGSGIDTVLSTISIKLTGSAQVLGAVENLRLIGTAAINGGGTVAGNVMIGNAAANVLSGSAGNDVLIGGAGRDGLIGGPHTDYFVFNAPLSNANYDTITDFSHVDDVFRLENAVMTRLGGPGALNPAFFRAGAVALDANDFIIYNRVTGFLDYDANGNAAGGVVHLALLTNKPANIAANDFAVI